MSELCQRQPVRPIGLVVIDINPEIVLDLLIHPFHLTIGVRSIGCRRVHLDTKKPVEFAHEPRDVSGITVRDNLPRYTVISYHPVSRQFCDSLAIDLHGHRFGMKPFGECINPDLDGIIPVAHGKRADEVHGYDFPWSSRYLVRVQVPLRPPQRPCPLARLAVADVLFYLVAHAWPPVISFHQLLRAALPRVSHQRIIMMMLDNPFPELGISRDINFFPIDDKAVPLFPSGQLLLQGKPDRHINPRRGFDLVGHFFVNPFQGYLLGSEELWLKKNDVLIVVLALVVISSPG